MKKLKSLNLILYFLVSSLLLVFGCAKEDDSKTSTDNVTTSSDTDNTSSVTSVPTGMYFIQFTVFSSIIRFRLIIESSFKRRWICESWRIRKFHLWALWDSLMH